MKNVPSRATGEAMSKTKPKDPRFALSFFRKATKEEMKAGTFGYVSWSVEPTGDHCADIELGHAIAEEALGFMAANPTIGHMTLIGDMLRDMARQGNKTHRSIITGFGNRVGQFAAIAVAGVGVDAIRKAERERDAEREANAAA